MFEQFGTVEEAIIISRNNKSLGFGFVTMSTLEEAKKAQEALNNTSIDDRQISVDGTIPRHENRVYLYNIPYALTDEKFAAYFKDYQPTQARIIKRNNRSLGYGFVEFSSAEEQKKILAEHPAIEIEGRIVGLRTAVTKSSHTLDRSSSPSESLPKPSSQSETLSPLDPKESYTFTEGQSVILTSSTTDITSIPHTLQLPPHTHLVVISSNSPWVYCSVADTPSLKGWVPEDRIAPFKTPHP